MTRTDGSTANATPNAPVECFRGPITLNDGHQELTADGSISWRWLPRPMLAFSIPETRGLLTILGEVKLQIPGGKPVRAHVTRMHAGSHEPTRVAGQLHDRLEIGTDSNLREVHFQIPNLSEFISVPNDGSPDWRIGRVKLSGGGWNVVVDAVPHLKKLQEEMREVGGFGITHTALARRADGSAFGSDQITDLSSCLYYFLSFVEGNWIGVILPRGRGADGEELWRAYAPWRLEPWQDVLSWADRHGGSMLSGAFAGFMTRWAEAAWRELLKLAIYWHIESNRNGAGLEAGIVLSQGALDAIAWQYLVLDQKTLSRSKFKSMSASERLRHLAGLAGIPLAMPPDAVVMRRNAGPNQWVDLVDAITAVRNMIVHPDSKDRQHLFMSEMPQEAWLSGSWLLELMTLWLIGFRGTYNDRRKSRRFVGDVATVPWAWSPTGTGPCVDDSRIAGL